MERIISKPNLKYMNTSHNLSSDFSLNATVELFYVFEDPRVYFTIAIPKNNADKKYESSFFHTTVNLCKILRGQNSDIFSKTFYKMVKRYSTTEWKCPNIIGKYEIFKALVDDDFIPKLIPLIDFKACVRVKLIGKALPEKKLVEILNLEAYVKFNKS